MFTIPRNNTFPITLTSLEGTITAHVDPYTIMMMHDLGYNHFGSVDIAYYMTNLEDLDNLCSYYRRVNTCELAYHNERLSILKVSNAYVHAVIRFTYIPFDPEHPNHKAPITLFRRVRFER